MRPSIRHSRAALSSRGDIGDLVMSKIGRDAYPPSNRLKRSLSNNSFSYNCRNIPPSLYVGTELWMSTYAQHEKGNALVGIDWIKESVVKVLNETFDAKEVARAAALAKLEPKQKKKKKKSTDEVSDDVEKPEMSMEEKEAIAAAAAQAAKPFNFEDTMVTPATRLEFGDYQCNAAMGLAKNVGMSPRECALKIVDGLRPLIKDIMEEPEIAGPGFINLRFKKDYLEHSIESMAKDTNRLAVPLTR